MARKTKKSAPATGGVIRILGAREHNLKNLSVDIPRGRFVVVTGVSGSGKSTLAFDLLFAEGQRRFLDSMSAYARQFVEQLSRPEVDQIIGIPPTVSIEQRNTRGGGKSTIATVTEIHHFIRLLFARLGTQYCPDCAVPVEALTRDRLAERLVQQTRERGELLLLAPLIRNRKGYHTEVAEWAARHGYPEIRADGRMYSTEEPFRLDRFKEHDIEVVVGVLEPRRLMKGGSVHPETRALVETAIDLGKGTVFALDDQQVETVHSTLRACPKCDRAFPELDPKMFSYNSSRGWCPTCRGFGETFPIPDVDRGANGDAVEESWYTWLEDQRETCTDCNGARLSPIPRAVRLTVLRSPKNCTPTVDDFSRFTVRQAHAFFQEVVLEDRAAEIARDILPEIRERLRFLEEVGLDYLALGRGVPTLSGGEAQRIRLAAQLGSNLSGVLYILDEPTIGLHARDNDRLLEALTRLRSRGNSLVVVEHDEDTMRRADHILDLGPGAGVHGGELVAQGTLEELKKHPSSLTGACLRAPASHPLTGQRRPVSKPPSKGRGKAGWLVLKGIRRHNLQDVCTAFPLGRLTVVTGVSGAGKSTLIRGCLHPALKRTLSHPESPDPDLSGWDDLGGVEEVDQSPIGRTPRSTPATYVGFFDLIRKLFAQTPEARMRGYQPGRFSFNSTQGRCPECQGAGLIKMEMNFLPPAFVRCETCEGLRFTRETLDIEWNGRNIAQVLDLDVEDAIEFFSAIQTIRRPLEALRDTGLGYLKLGQTSPTLSGGEAQRIKLVSHLLGGLRETPVLRKKWKKVFLLEEPTIGLHMADVKRLAEVLHRLVDAGHTVIVIEHNLDLVAEADWVVDMGPEGGEAGGQVVAACTPEDLIQHKHSHTGRFLATHLSQKSSQ